MAFRQQFKSHVRFILMNSFSTSADTLGYLSKYPTLVADPNLELLQNKVRPSIACLFVCVCVLAPRGLLLAWCPFLTPRTVVSQSLSAYLHLTHTPSPPAIQYNTTQVPKVDAQTLQPAQWPTNPNLEWCPPGHGDLYAALAGSGTLDKLLADGVKVGEWLERAGDSD